MNSALRVVALVLLASTLVSCSKTESGGTNVAVTPATRCPGGTRPPLDACSYDGLTADCGGDGSDRWLACDLTTCRFFEGGCVAEGFDTTLCNLEDPCCTGSALDHADVTIEGQSWSVDF